MTDAEWLAALPAEAEFLSPPGWEGAPVGARGRCRVNVADYAESYPDEPCPPGSVPVEVWAGGIWPVPVAELRTWERYR